MPSAGTLPGVPVSAGSAPPIEVLEERDTKGLYRKARAGEIKNFTGISDPYEAPEKAEVVVRTHDSSIEKSAQVVLDYLVGAGLIGG